MQCCMIRCDSDSQLAICFNFHKYLALDGMREGPVQHIEHQTSCGFDPNKATSPGSLSLSADSRFGRLCIPLAFVQTSGSAMAVLSRL